jgi:cytochrome P450
MLPSICDRSSGAPGWRRRCLDMFVDQQLGSTLRSDADRVDPAVSATTGDAVGQSEASKFDTLDISSMAFWKQSAIERDDSFAVLRRDRPVSWHPPAESPMAPTYDGFWAVVRNADIVEVSRRSDLFCSGQGTTFEDIPFKITEFAEAFLNKDGEMHNRLRRLVSSAFTPRQVARTEAQVAQQAERIVDDLLETREGDLVEQVSRRLPLWTISEMMGVPESLRPEFMAAADGVVSQNDPTVRGAKGPVEFLLDSIATLHTISTELAAARRRTPGEDLMTNLVRAEVDGQLLTDDEIASFFVLLAVAGNDTTRNTTSHSVYALDRHPQQRAWLTEDLADRIPTAVEEFLRWGSAVMTFRRTATIDTVLSGQEIAQGDRVVMFYSSGNRDERVFAEPWTLDLTRNPNPHVTFGGGGVHFCLGAPLARTQLRALFSELLARVPNLTVGEPEFLVSNFMHAVTSLPYRIGD